MGGPESLDKVYPFLKNLFSDKHIFPYPKLAKFIGPLFARVHLSKSKKNYAVIGGKSNLLNETIEQASALKDANKDLKVFVAMSYSKPFIQEVFKEVLDINPKNVVLIPLYPMYSTTTTLSCINSWQYLENMNKVSWSTKIIRSFYDNPLFIKAHVDLINRFSKKEDRLIFSAHSLPVSVIEKGDPYQKQIESTVKLIMDHFKNRDFRLCYQSKIGPIKWLTPSLETCLKEAILDEKSVSIIPISFVSEHIETLFELDIEFRDFFTQSSDLSYTRIPAIRSHPYFIDMLSELAKTTN